MSDVDFENRTLKSFFKVVNQSVSQLKKQVEIKDALLNDPATNDFKSLIQRQELSTYGVKKDHEDVYVDMDQKAISLKEKDKIDKNIEVRMLTESPNLSNLNLMNVQGKILLDSESIKNAVRRGEGNESARRGY